MKIAVPLILIAVYLRMRFLLTLPDPIFHMDSASYLEPVFRYLTDGIVDIPITRTPEYSLFLAVLLKISRSFNSVLIVQHFFSLLIAICAACLYYFVFDRSRTKALLVGFGVSLLPGQLTYAHTIMNEVPYGFLLIAAVFSLLLNPEKNLHWFATGILCALAILMRPVGLALMASCVAALLMWRLRRRLFQASGAYAAGLALVLLPYFIWSGVHRGFWGLTRYSGHSLFGNTAYLLDSRLVDGNWVRFSAQGPVAALQNEHPGADIDPLLMKLALTGIRQHPFRLAWDKIGQTLDFVLRRSSGPQYIQSKEFTVMGGLYLYGRMARDRPEIWRYVRYNPAQEEAYFQRISSSWLYPFDLGMPPRWIMAVIPAAAMIMGGIFVCWGDLRRKEIALLMLVVFSHVFLSTLVTDYNTPRHAIPIEPLYLICFAYGFNANCWQRLKSFFHIDARR